MPRTLPPLEGYILFDQDKYTCTEPILNRGDKVCGAPAIVGIRNRGRLAPRCPDHRPADVRIVANPTPQEARP